MKIKFIKPKSEIAQYVDLFWVFECDFGLPVFDSRIVVPNGTSKIIIPLKNSIYTHVNEKEFETKEQKIHLTGLWDKPTVISSHSSYTGTIGIDFTPIGTSALFPFSMKEFKNSIFTFEDIFGNFGQNLQEQLANLEDIEAKTELIQNFIITLLKKTKRQNSIFNYCVNEIKKNKGLLEIKELERKTGYSKRYLDMIFKDCIGISPKTLTGIVRFNVFYYQWSKQGVPDFYTNFLYDFYYDQSHFIKEFKRFSGHTPKQFTSIGNEFGRLFM
jgi:AraC-like DNA-binding protein